MVKHYGDDAMIEAAERADQLLAKGDMAAAYHSARGALTWSISSRSPTRTGPGL
jgi:hypothetical protein